MADTKFLCYKGKPLVRKDNEIYYGDMTEKFVVRFQILSEKKDIADEVKVQLLKNDTDDAIEKRIAKESTKSTLFDALDIGFIWLERALKD